MEDIADLTRRIVIHDLTAQGFTLNSESEIETPSSLSKEAIRKLHAKARKQKLISQKAFIQRALPELSSFFADGKTINTEEFNPVVHLVLPGTIFSRLFRLATLLWSVPVSEGFGRRLKFLVFNESHDSLIGLFGLGDPVFNLRARDRWIGWNQGMRRERLYNVLDVYVAGAVPPYSQLLCGKLIAMLATSKEIQKAVYEKYSNKITVVRGQSKTPHCVLLTTSSALGRSSMYNRLTLNGRHLFIHIGETEGWGHFHLSNSTFDHMRKYLTLFEHPIVKANRFGNGPNWKIRTIRTALESLNLPSSLLQHGIKRHIYIAPLADNYIEYLNNTVDIPIYNNMTQCDIINYFKERWFYPRFSSCQAYRDITRANTLKELIQIAEGASDA